jgi:glycosyltransferase involved in cell wall biosynthesis
MCAALIAREVRSRRAHLAVENLEDLRAVEGRGPAFGPDRATRLPGAGVELDRFAAHPDPGGAEIRVGVAARLVRSKGVGVAVAAVRRLRAEGLAIALDIAGAPDPENPAAIEAAECARWTADGAATLHGHVTDISGFWAARHIACLPSLGGEGLPRSLLEAAASARPIVTTTVGGCSEFVRHDETGLLVPPGDPVALAAALKRLAADKGLRARLGASGRAQVEAGYSVAHLRAAVANAWRATLQPQGGPFSPALVGPQGKVYPGRERAARDERVPERDRGEGGARR